MKTFSTFMLICFAIVASSLSVSAQESFAKLAFMGENVEINDVNIGWDPTQPVVIDVNPESGKFEFTARFLRNRALWQMYTSAIGENDWGAIKSSIYSPNFYVAFADLDPFPEDITVIEGGVECFNMAYLQKCVGTPVPVFLDPDGGFWAGGGSREMSAYKYHIEVSADLSEMTIVSYEIGELPEVEYPEALYIIGDATPGGWDLENATAMTNLGDGIYQYVGELKAGDPGAIQIYGEHPAICGTEANAYGPASPQIVNSWGVENGSLSYYETGRPSGCYYTIQAGETNNYVMTVDLVNNTIMFLLNNLYLVGTPTDWGFVQMENEGNRVFSYSGYLKSDDLFTLTATQGWDRKIATFEDAIFGLNEYSNNTLYFGSPYSMKSTYEGYYVVKADLNNNIFSTKTYNPNPVEKLFISSNGTYTEMTAKDNGKFMWTGTLNGSFIITPQADAYPCYMATSDIEIEPETGLANNEMIFNVTSNNNYDKKWTVGNANTYTVTVDPAAMTLSVVKGDIDGINNAVANESNAPVVFYDLMGNKVMNPENGIYIRKQGSQVTKVIIQ